LIDWSPLVLLLAALGAPGPASPADPVEFAQLVVREHVLIRVPANLRPNPRVAVPIIDWKEKKGPKCVPMRLIAGAALVRQDSVDLVLRDRSRVRAKLERSCPAIDYYRGFYVRPNSDGQICSDRDAFRSRSGAECEIDKFRTLVARKAD
jgi:hypothetical protein